MMLGLSLCKVVECMIHAFRLDRKREHQFVHLGGGTMSSRGAARNGFYELFMVRPPLKAIQSCKPWWPRLPPRKPDCQDGW
eukprot:1685516-Karenia_brevis.AAC.1